MLYIFVITVVLSFVLGRIFQGIRIRRLKRRLSDLQRQKVSLQKTEEILSRRLMQMTNK